MLLLAASNMNSEAFAKFKSILESVVYYTVIDKIATNITERTFALWCRDVRNIIIREYGVMQVLKQVLRQNGEVSPEDFVKAH